MNSNASIIKHMGKLAVPVIATSMGNTVSSVINMLMIATLGHQLLAAGALATVSYVTLIAFSSACFMSVGILVSHAKGKQQEQQITQIVRNGLLLSIWLSIPVTLVMWFYPHILTAFHQDPSLVAATVSYFHLASISMLPNMASVVFQQFFTGIGRPKFNFYCTLVRIPIALFISYAFIFGKWGLPALGLGGIMVGPAIVQWCYLVFLVLYVKLKSEFNCYQFFASKKIFSRFHCINITKIGLPIGLQFGVELSAMTVATYFMGWIGSTALAAQQIVSQCTMVVVMIILGLSQSVSLMISHAYGQDDYVLIRRIGNIGFGMGLIVMATVALLYVGFHNQLISLFIDIHDPSNSQILHLSQIFLYLSSLLLVIDSLRNITAGALRGMHDSQTPMWIGTACLWLISIPTCYFVAFNFGGGAIGLRAGFITGFVVCTAILLRRFYHKVNRHILNSEAVQSTFA